MINFSLQKIVFSILKIPTIYIFLVFSTLLTNFVNISDVYAQTAEQIEMAKQLGLDSDFLKNNKSNIPETGLGENYEDFMFKSEKPKEKEDLRKYLGFRENLMRFGEDLFSKDRGDFKIADDSQAPDSYVLGLGDQIIIQYYGSETDEFLLEIGRDGSILLPKIGPIFLNGIQLSEAKSIITSRVKKQLVGVNVTTSIGKTKFINVFIAGNVNNPGVYSMPSLSRVTHALYLAGGISDMGTYRNVQVKRQGKLVGQVDLYDFLVNGDNSSDINLKPNDVILVGVSKNNIQITGAVKRPGIYEISGKEKVNQLLEFAGGVAPGADRKNIVYSSLSSGNPTQILNFDELDTFEFFDGDELYIKFKPTVFTRVNNSNIKSRSSAIRVDIQGAVNFPGTYLLKSGEKINDLIERAGGLTDTAFLDGAVFTRETVRNREAFRARELAEEVRRQVVSSSQTQSTNKLDVDDVEYITNQLENYTGIGRVIIDLPRAIAGRRDANLTLLDGDALFVPTRSNTVTVFGEVRRQSSFVYNGSYEIEDYILLAAGTTQLADEDNIYIVKANGNIEIPSSGWFEFGSSKLIDEGDTIIVPVDYSYRQSLPFWRDVISIVYQGAVAVAAINGL